MSFQQILDMYRAKAWNEHDKGERFEILMKRFLLSYPIYENELPNASVKPLNLFMGI